jgi:DNA-binding beta-propeller fold protein YncE
LLQRPFGLAATKEGFAVADPDGSRVLLVSWRARSAVPVGCPNVPWQMPMAVAVTPDGTLFVADGKAKEVVRVRAGVCQELGKGLFERPSGLAVLKGRVYVADPPRHEVIALDLEGHELLRFGSRGVGQGQLNFPTNLYASNDESLYVIDALNFRIVEYAADGRFLNGFGQPGDGEGAFGRPKAMAVDTQGRLYVTDAQNDVVIVFGPDRSFEFAVEASQEPKLTMPAGIAVGDGHLYVADSFNHRVVAYKVLEEGHP